MRTQNCLIISTESQPQLSGKGAKRKSRLQRMNSSVVEEQKKGKDLHKPYMHTKTESRSFFFKEILGTI